MVGDKIPFFGIDIGYILDKAENWTERAVNNLSKKYLNGVASIFNILMDLTNNTKSAEKLNKEIKNYSYECDEYEIKEINSETFNFIGSYETCEINELEISTESKSVAKILVWRKAFKPENQTNESNSNRSKKGQLNCFLESFKVKENSKTVYSKNNEFRLIYDRCDILELLYPDLRKTVIINTQKINTDFVSPVDKVKDHNSKRKRNSSFKRFRATKSISSS